MILKLWSTVAESFSQTKSSPVDSQGANYTRTLSEPHVGAEVMQRVPHRRHLSHFADGPFYVNTTAVQSLKEQWYIDACQSPGTQVSLSCGQLTF